LFYDSFHSIQGLRIGRDSIVLACVLLVICSVCGSHLSLLSVSIAILIRWQIEAVRWPISADCHWLSASFYCVYKVPVMAWTSAEMNFLRFDKFTQQGSRFCFKKPAVNMYKNQPRVPSNLRPRGPEVEPIILTLLLYLHSNSYFIKVLNKPSQEPSLWQRFRPDRSHQWRYRAGRDR